MKIVAIISIIFVLLAVVLSVKMYMDHKKPKPVEAPKWTPPPVVVPEKPAVIEVPVKKVVEPIKQVPVVIKAASFNGKVLKAKVSRVKQKGVKAVLNVGYCSYDASIGKDGSVTIQPDWIPPSKQITFGIYDPATGKYLSSVKL